MLYGLNVTIRRSLVLLLVGLTTVLAPLAQATPPDPSWLGGFFDNADYDDVVVQIVSGVAAVESLAPRGADPGPVVPAPAPSSDESLRGLAQPSSSPPRAPPVA